MTSSANLLLSQWTDRQTDNLHVGERDPTHGRKRACRQPTNDSTTLMVGSFVVITYWNLITVGVGGFLSTFQRIVAGNEWLAIHER